MEQTQLQFEEAEQILSWRKMQCRFRSIEHRGINDYGRPIGVITLERDGEEMCYYAPASLYWDLKRRPETRYIKYEGTQPSAKGYDYPVFKFAKMNKICPQ